MTIYEHTAVDRTPYTYLIGWTELDIWYYGVRFRKGCHPDDLWTKYFTSSDRVKQFREEHGDPDVIQVRHTFTTIEKAQYWESDVIRKVDAVSSVRWLNQHDPKGRFHKSGPMGDLHKERIRKRAKERVENGTCHLSGPEFNQKRVDAGTHQCLTRSDGTNINTDRVNAGTHHWLTRSDGTNINTDRVNAGTHHLLGPKQNQRRIDAGTHNFLGGELGGRISRERVKNGTHPFLLANTPKAECPHCGGLFNPGALVRWHGDNCKKNPINIINNTPKSFNRSIINALGDDK